MQGATHIKEELERARLELETARRAQDLQRMSELQYGRFPSWRSSCRTPGRRDAGNTLLRNKVTDEEIAEVVSKWTGIPCRKMLEGEKDKLLRMEDALHERVVGQDEAVTRLPTRSGARAPGCRTRIARTARSCSSGRPASARPS